MILVSPEFLDAKKTPLSHRAVRLFLVLDSIARTDPYCYPASETIAQAMGLHESKSREILAELEGAGWIKRLHDARMKRLGIILLRRVGPGTPAADTPERLADAEAALRARHGLKRCPQPPGIGQPSRPESVGPSRPESVTEQESLVVKEAIKNHSEEAAGAPGQEASAPATRPIGEKTEDRDEVLISNENENEKGKDLPDSGKSSATQDQEPLSPEKRRLIERLLELGGPAAQQARRHLAMDDKARAKIAGGGTMMTSPKPHERMGPGELKTRIATIMEKSKASPQTMAMLEGLGPGCPPAHVDGCVWRLCRELDGAGYSQGFFVQTLNEVRQGQRSAESVALAYAQACGPKVRNRGAAFVAAIKKT